VSCRRHGVVVAAVPWARHDARFTRSFDDQVAWLACHCSKSAVCELQRIAWRSVGSILERVSAEARRRVDLLDGLRRIGIDEISHKKGQRYLTVVVDHHTGRLIWAAAGRDRRTVLQFFDALGEERCKEIELVSCDMAAWISGPVAERCPNAVRCVDPFHVVQLATDALDEVRREVWREARRQGNLELATELKGARFAVWKNPENLTDRQHAKLSEIQKTNGPLYRAYLLKEQLREIYRLPASKADKLLDRWVAWARRCQMPAFVKLARTITAQRDGILAAITHGLSNSRVEQLNTQIRLITRQAFGFHSPTALIALAMLKLGGLCPPLPGR
jgi:transposase